MAAHGHALGAPPRQEPPQAEVAALSTSRAAQRALPTPAERPSALRARRRPPRVRPPWWPAVALLLAAIFGGVAVGAVGANCVPPAESPPR
ncbi:MAG: hypothetical protein M5U28_33240 [Sandaracinaceae bacterium]|nr:hypothetical protein [Sandaracinaceae bacterium]